MKYIVVLEVEVNLNDVTQYDGEIAKEEIQQKAILKSMREQGYSVIGFSILRKKI